MPARNARHIARTFPQELVAVLECLEIPSEVIGREIDEMQECAIAATNNRSVLGTLNDFSFLLRSMMERCAGRDPFDVALSLCDAPVGPLGYDTPDRVTVRLLTAAWPHDMSPAAPPATKTEARAVFVATPPVARTTVDGGGAATGITPPRERAPRPAEAAVTQAAHTTVRTWITDIRHFLDEMGRIPDDLPGPALGVAMFVGSIAAWVTSPRGVGDLRTNVACRWSPAGRTCPGIIEAGLSGDGETIFWHCPVCGDNGQVRGWEGTPWDRRRR